jgi:DNA-binding response OmpR family regulator
MAVDIARVLIADSDSGLRQQLYSALLTHDIYADSVSSTSAALAKLGEESYGVVVIDVALQPGDVDRVIERIAAMPALLRPVVLVLAANPELARSLDVDIVQIVLRKPVNLGQLVDLARSCIRNTRGRGGTAGGATPNNAHARS